MMVTDCQPFCDSGFKKMIKVLEPRYNLPSRTTFSDIVTAMYKKEKERIIAILKNDIKTTETVAFTTDGWTSRSNKNYLSVTAYYLGCDFNIKNFTLKISNVTKSHTGEHINSFLKDTLAEWCLDNSQLWKFFVTDNAANILVIKDAIKLCEELMAILQKCRKIVRYFHRSSAANEKLTAELQYPEKRGLKLINDCETRWNSQYDMLIRLINVRRALNTVLCDPWMRFQEYSNCLKIFKETTEILTMENKLTLPWYIAKIYDIRDTTTNMLEMETDDTGEISNLKKYLIVELENRFHFATMNKYLIVGMILDPRIKNRLLSPEKKEEANEILHVFAIKYTKSSIANDAIVAEENVGVSSSS